MASIVRSGCRYGIEQGFLIHIAAWIYHYQRYQPQASEVLGYAKVRLLPRINDKKMFQRDKAFRLIDWLDSLAIKVFVGIKNHHNSERMIITPNLFLQIQVDLIDA